MRRAALLLGLALVAVVGQASSCPRPGIPGGPPCSTAVDCNVDEACRDGVCVKNGAEGEGEGQGGEGEGEGQSGCVPACIDAATEQLCDANGQPVVVPCNPGDSCTPPGLCQGPGCHNDGECQPGNSCVSPDAPPQCGAQPVPEPDQCAQSSECAPGSVCDFAQDPCNQHHLACVPACGADPTCVTGDQCDCAVDEQCNAGRCEARACQDGVFLCPSHQVCNARRPNPLVDGNDHGCDPSSCTTDADCPPNPGGFIVFLPPGHCVDFVCASGPGACQPPVP